MCGTVGGEARGVGRQDDAAPPSPPPGGAHGDPDPWQADPLVSLEWDSLLFETEQTGWRSRVYTLLTPVPVNPQHCLRAYTRQLEKINNPQPPPHRSNTDRHKPLRGPREG